MSQISQKSMMWQASKSWSMLADTLGELSEPDTVSKLLSNTTNDMEEALRSINEGNVEQNKTTFLAVRESQNFLDGLALRQSPGEVSTALETIEFTIRNKVSNMGTMVDTLDESTGTMEASEAKVGSAKVNESSGDSEDADSRDQSNNSVHCVLSIGPLWSHSSIDTSPTVRNLSDGSH
ncbi:hypothetical protein BEWA_035340 [Theileria equi strain WA]|uniref:Uncharacterized protein n=1 Tax=Theileria equi strain WA TaxID=1537102 RepID=L1LEA4_THEEQ|nr:hypothetical protein BEWA_035340 [Theileria equi strain WA]EKX73498.1 hypothetical protein BEWA_035340 [Theileria equi strain WA]|eukprot:XP_004832950.1 hypothetical protein BEWA_035340 [Theileria equi strain WA]